MLIFNKLLCFVWFAVVLFVSGCSNQSPKSIDSAEVTPEYGGYHTPSGKTLRHKKLTSRTGRQKQHFTENDLIWDRLFSLYSLPEIDDPRVERELNWFLNHPDYIVRVQQRAEPYLYQIVNEIEAQELPGEMALLPVVESAFRPEAVSNASAAGLWQFMPGTGKDFGLKQDWWYDGRHDVFTSTQAAASYLKDLSEHFDGDWLLALASYNYGKGNIQKAIGRNLVNGEATDYWSLRSLPQETMNYVPKLLAVAKLFAHAKEYNIDLKAIHNKPVFELVDVGAPLYLDQAAAMANTNPERFLKLNPAFKQNCTAPDGPHHLLIPVAQVKNFKENLEKIPEEQKQELTNQLRNQRLEMLAAQRAVEFEQIAIKEEVARAAQREREEQQALKVLAERKAIEERLERQKAKAELMFAKRVKKVHEDGETIYTVKKSDTLLKLARSLAVDPKELAAINNISTQHNLLVGQRLIIKNKPQAQPHLLTASFNTSSSPIQTIQYTVKKGESLTGIARKFNVSVADIRKWNATTLSDNLHTGQRLKVIVATSQAITLGMAP